MKKISILCMMTASCMLLSCSSSEDEVSFGETKTGVGRDAGLPRGRHSGRE